MRICYAGTLSVTAGAGMPSELDYVCTWQVAPSSVLRHDNCVVELDIFDVELNSAMTQHVPTMTILVKDTATVRRHARVGSLASPQQHGVRELGRKTPQA